MPLTIAGDIGGTNSRLQLFDTRPDGRELLVHEHTYASQKYQSMEDILSDFLQQYKQKVRAGLVSSDPLTPHSSSTSAASHNDSTKVAACCLAVAGPVSNDICKMTNVNWVINGRNLEKHLGITKVIVINDFAGIGYGLLGLTSHDYLQLNPGVQPTPNAPKACLGAGTGLGECYLTHNSREYDVWSCEGGHTDFPARDEFEFRLMEFVKKQQSLEHVSIERMCSGMGLTNIFDFICSVRGDKHGMHPGVQSAISSGRDKNSVIAEYALSGQCSICVESMQRFISIYGAEAGNLALKTLPYGGIYIAGGIAAKVMWAVTKGNAFVEAFLDKGRMKPILQRIPIYVVFEPHIGLLGSRVMCRRILRNQGFKVDGKEMAKRENFEHLRIHSRL